MHRGAGNTPAITGSGTTSIVGRPGADIYSSLPDGRRVSRAVPDADAGGFGPTRHPLVANILLPPLVLPRPLQGALRRAGGHGGPNVARSTPPTSPPGRDARRARPAAWVRRGRDGTAPCHHTGLDPGRLAVLRTASRGNRPVGPSRRLGMRSRHRCEARPICGCLLSCNGSRATSDTTYVHHSEPNHPQLPAPGMPRVDRGAARGSRPVPAGWAPCPCIIPCGTKHAAGCQVREADRDSTRS